LLLLGLARRVEVLVVRVTLEFDGLLWWVAWALATLVVDCHKSAERSPPVRRIPDDVEPDLARLLVLASLPARRGVFGVEALVRPTPCSLVRDTDLEWMVDRVAAFGRFAPIMFM